MAVLTTNRVTPKIPIGPHWAQTYSVVTTGAGNADEWIVTDFHSIVAVMGSSVIGSADRGHNFVLNAQGTGQSAGSTPGALGVETATGGGTLHVTVIGG